VFEFSSGNYKPVGKCLRLKSDVPSHCSSSESFIAGKARNNKSYFKITGLQF
jgi:hypothetical protein